MTETPAQTPTLAQCPACGHETLTTEPTGWRAIGPRLTCTSEGCDYSHDIPALAAPAPCSKPLDPKPWLTYTMQTGSAGGWAGQARFKPRPQYCQDRACYTKQLAPARRSAAEEEQPPH